MTDSFSVNIVPEYPPVMENRFAVSGAVHHRFNIAVKGPAVAVAEDIPAVAEHPDCRYISRLLVHMIPRTVKMEERESR